MKEKRYVIDGLHCANCAAKMETKMNQLPNVEAVITFTTRQLRVSAEDPDGLLPQLQEIVSSVESEAVIRQRADGKSHAHSCCDHCHGEASEHAHEHTHSHDHSHGESEPVWPLLVGTALFALGLVMGWLGIPYVNVAAYLGAYLLLGLPVLGTAVKNLVKGRVFDENFLMSLATLGAFAIREYPEAVGVMLFFRVGEFFEEKAVERSRSQIMEAVDLRPEVVTLADGPTIPASQAAVGDVLLVRPGDRIPLDGVVVSGQSRIDTSPITGEPVPIAIKPGEPVTSGCVNMSGQLTVRVEKPLSESMVTRILNAVENAAAGKPKLDRFITRFSRIYTPVVVLGALVTAVVPSLITGDWNYWVYTALSFLVMSCPCALVLSVPLAFFAGIGTGSKRGILFKGGLAIEALAGVQVVAMDKTGTVTRGDFRVQEVVGPPELLELCAALERHSTHPIAVSITSAAMEQGIRLAEPAQLEEIAGHGVRGLVDGRTVLCGNRRLMEKFSVAVPEDVPASAVLAAADGKYLGHIIISDTLKPDGRKAVERLKQLGVSTVMLTGDSEENAGHVAKEAGIDRVYARLLPEEKLEKLQKIRAEQGCAMFVGDGINDAPVLAGADVGAAMGSGADAAIEAADVVYMTSDVKAIPDSLEIARRTRTIAMENVIFALAIKAAVMVLGLLGHASMWMAVFADSGVAMLCVLNSIRQLYRKEK